MNVRLNCKDYYHGQVSPASIFVPVRFKLITLPTMFNSCKVVCGFKEKERMKERCFTNHTLLARIKKSKEQQS